MTSAVRNIGRAIEDLYDTFSRLNNGEPLLLDAASGNTTAEQAEDVVTPGMGVSHSQITPSEWGSDFAPSAVEIELLEYEL